MNTNRMQDTKTRVALRDLEDITICWNKDARNVTLIFCILQSSQLRLYVSERQGKAEDQQANPRSSNKGVFVQESKKTVLKLEKLVKKNLM